MNIGIVTTWFERGAAYVSKIYMDLLQKEGHNVYIYARGGEQADCNDPKWNGSNVTRDVTYSDHRVNKKKFNSWIKSNSIEALLFNEQHMFSVIVDVKETFPNVKVGAYVDYYTENTIPWYNIYDFVICNTHRHMEAMKNHPQKFYVQWGTDISLYKPAETSNAQLTFFHSAGMSVRKGTDILVDAFIDGGCYKKSKLIIHTQLPIGKVCRYQKDELEKYNIEVIEKTVTAPGLYYMGDVYVYPTRLDGLGLTMYEALSSGLPVITTNFPPMNEAVNSEIGRLVKVQDFYCRGDAYYFPMAICDKDDLINCMNWYIENPDELVKQKKKAREYAETNYDISSKSKEVSKVFENAVVRDVDVSLSKLIRKSEGFMNRKPFDKVRSNNNIMRIVKKLKA